MNHKTPLLVLGTTLFTLNPLVASAAVTTTGCALTDTCTLTELLGGGEFTAGDLRFHSFSQIYIGDGVIDEKIDEGIVSLTGLDNAGLDPGPGFRFNGNGELKTLGGSLPTLGYVFEFDVEHVGGSSVIKDASLTAGTGSIGTEDEWLVQARIPGDKLAPDLEIIDSTIVPGTVLSDSFSFAPVSGIEVRNTINLDSEFGSGAALDDYTFRVSVVPLPAALPLAAFALGLLALVGRRRSSPDPLTKDPATA